MASNTEPPSSKPNNYRYLPALESQDEYYLMPENPFVSRPSSSASKRTSSSRNVFSSVASLNIFKDGVVFSDRHKTGIGPLLKGPRRILRLCLFGTILPVLLISIPLYVRLMLYPPFHYAMAPTDQRLLNQKSSSVWCQAQKVEMNGNFDAYLMSEGPQEKKELSNHTMVRHLTLKDDVKEYWGFFLHKGSIVTINLCTRYDGGMLMIMRGLHNLRKCAWIGEEDSAEQDEDHKDTSNESGEPPEFYQEVPIVIKDSDILHEKNGVLMRMNESIKKESLTKTSSERKKELDYYVQKAIELSKHKGELIHRFNHHSNKIDKMNNLEMKENNINIKNKDKINTKLNIHQSKEDVEGDGSSINELRRLKRSLEMDQDTGAMEMLDDEAIQQMESDHGRQNSSSEVPSDLKQMYLSLFHLPNGLTYERGKINQTTNHDTSNEEHRSSFSSSEEALTKCDGLLGIMPLYQSAKCNSVNHPSNNRIRYKIPVTGTYYFVFSSDNEVFDSEIYFNMTLQRVVFDTSNATSSCLNQKNCSLPFSFWSQDQMVVSLPESDWNASFTLDVTCQPRVAIYLAILIMVPIAILFCTLY